MINSIMIGKLMVIPILYIINFEEGSTDNDESENDTNNSKECVNIK